MDLIDEIVEIVRSRNYSNRGNRCFTKKLVGLAEAEDCLDVALYRAFNVLASTDLENAQAASVARRVCTSFANTVAAELVGPKGVISTGIEILDWFAAAGVIQAEKRKQIVDGPKGAKAVDVWFLKACVDFPKEDHQQIYCDPRKPYVPWLGPTRFDSGSTIPIVKRAEQHKLLDEYTPEKIPLLYSALNRIGNAQWEINEHLYNYACLIDEDNSPLPPVVPEEELTKAQNAMRNVKASKKRRMDATKLIGAQEKRKAFDKIMEYAYEYYGHTLQFPHNLCGRGRIYALSPTLNPQGADIAKALLVLKEKRPIVKRELYIHLANCAGVDKLTYEGRIQWVEDNIETLDKIGEDPIGNWALIQELGVHKEKKTYYQFISTCMELNSWLADDSYQTGIMLGLDSTSSGNQILAMLARDHEVAEYVNISMTDSGAPGDLYAYVGRYVKDAMDKLTIDEVTPKMKPHVNMEAIQQLAALPKGHKTFRKITKRICMVLPYSGTKYGAGEITKDDQFDHGSEEMNNLNFADCSVVGKLIYECCEDAARRSMDFKDYMCDNLETNEVLVTWRVPHTNFLAFQSKERMKEASVVGRIGTKDISLKVYLPTGQGNSIQHKNAISPGMVHSLDAAMLALIINGIPMEIPVGAIHDQFCVPFGHMNVLVESARQAYAAIADRDKFMDMAESCFGKRIPLPQPGTWRLDDLSDSDYFIC